MIQVRGDCTHIDSRVRAMSLCRIPRSLWSFNIEFSVPRSSEMTECTVSTSNFCPVMNGCKWKEENEEHCHHLASVDSRVRLINPSATRVTPPYHLTRDTPRSKYFGNVWTLASFNSGTPRPQMDVLEVSLGARETDTETHDNSIPRAVRMQHASGGITHQRLFAIYQCQCIVFDLQRRSRVYHSLAKSGMRKKSWPPPSTVHLGGYTPTCKSHPLETLPRGCFGHCISFLLLASNALQKHHCRVNSRYRRVNRSFK